MTDDAVIIKQKPTVLGQLLDTKAWLNRYRQARHDIVAVLRHVPSVVETFRQRAPQELYRIVWTPEMMTALRDGETVWKRNKDGFFNAVLRKPGGEIVKHLSLERMSPVQFAPMVQLTTQSMLAEVIERLEVIDQKVSAVLRGQVADRLGTLLGAEAQFREALTATGEDRRALLRHCVGPFNEGRGRALTYVRLELDKLSPDNTGWLRFFQYLLQRKSQGEHIEEKMKDIHLHLLAAIRATRYLEEIYEELDQPDSARQALSNFGEEVKPLVACGLKAALWILPHAREHLPEELWQLTQQLIGEPSRRAQALLTASTPSTELEIEVREILAEEKGHGTV